MRPCRNGTEQETAPGYKARIEARDGVIVIHSRRLMIEADSVVESQSTRHPPVILRIPFRVPEKVTSDRPVIGLRITIDAPQKRIGKAITGIERIIGVVGEAVAAAISELAGCCL